MKLIVGLGNPGKKYEQTYHNIGFILIDNFCSLNNIVCNKSKFNGLYTEFNVNGEKIILLKPQKYMNLSGEVVKQYISYFKINIDDILIIVDDLDIDKGLYKLKTNSGSAGHNGLKNIELHLGTKSYKRLKIGIKSEHTFNSTANYVLSTMDFEFINELNKFPISNLISEFCEKDFNLLMNKYNIKN